MKHRLHKLLSAAGVDSRRHVEQMVLDARIKVNGKVQRTLPVMVDPASDRVEVDGGVVDLSHAVTRRHYAILNKPKKILATSVAQGEQTTVIDIMPDDFPRVYPVGRLDAESTGLLLLTNDGELTNRLTHPRYGISKTYRVRADGTVSDEAIKQLQGGMWLADATGKAVKAVASRIEVVKRTREATVLDLTLREGRDGYIRRMLAKLGHKVRDVSRIKIGPLTLDGLNVGQWRMLTKREVDLLRKWKPDANFPGAAEVADPEAGDDDGPVPAQVVPAKRAAATDDEMQARFGRVPPHRRLAPRKGPGGPGRGFAKGKPKGKRRP